MSDSLLRCEKKGCGAPAPRLFLFAGQFICAPCVPDEAWKQYPNWQDRKADALRAFKTRNTRAALAKKNLRKAVQV